jgi:hypothetical protein
MGAKAWFVAYYDGDPKRVLAERPTLEKRASRKLAERMCPDHSLVEIDDGSLSYLNPGDDEVYVGHYGDLRIVAHGELGIDHPSRIDKRWFNTNLGRNAYVHLTHSVVDWFAYSVWRDGVLVRSLGLSPDSGIQEQIGDPLPFEAPYWAGKHPVTVDDDDDPYPLPFHPLELAEVSLLHHLGFQFEGRVDDWVCDPEEIAICRYKIGEKRPKWKFW